MSDEIKPNYYTGPQAGDFTAAEEPFALFDEWLKEAAAHEPNDPNAMALATVDPDGLPNVRMVLLKGVDGPERPDRGFVFFTNYESAKGASCLPPRRRLCASTGRACVDKCACGGWCRLLRRRRRMPISLHGRAAAGSVPGPVRNPGRWRAGLRWRRR